MIAAAESFSDVLERLARHIAAEIHDDLAREYEFFTSFLADEIKGCDAVMLFTRRDINIIAERRNKVCRLRSVKLAQINV